MIYLDYAASSPVWPEATEVLCHSEYALPLLVAVGYEIFHYEPGVGIRSVAGNGAEAEWYPALGDSENVIVPYGRNTNRWRWTLPAMVISPTSK